MPASVHSAVPEHVHCTDPPQPLSAPQDPDVQVGSVQHEPWKQVWVLEHPGHVKLWPQLSVKVPPQGYAAQLSFGMQHDVPERQTSPTGQPPQVIVCPQLLVNEPPQGYCEQLSFGAQHVDASVHRSVVVVQLPPLPQKTVWPQLFVVVPQAWLPHAVPLLSGVQPLHVPALQDWGEVQPGHVTPASQLSNSAPQRFWQNVGSDWHMQTLPASSAHVCPVPH